MFNKILKNKNLKVLSLVFSFLFLSILIFISNTKFSIASTLSVSNLSATTTDTTATYTNATVSGKLSGGTDTDISLICDFGTMSSIIHEPTNFDNATGDFSFEMTGLSPGSSYNCSVVDSTSAHNPITITDGSNANFTTNILSISDSSVQDITVSSAFVDGTLVGGSSSTVIKLFYGPTISGTQTYPNEARLTSPYNSSLTTNNFEFKIGDTVPLSQNSSYSYEITDSDGNKLSGSGSIGSFTTGSLSLVSSPDISSLTDNSAQITGHLSGGATTTSFKIMYGTGGAEALAGPAPIVDNTGFFIFNLTGLSQGTSYAFAISDLSGHLLSSGTGIFKTNSLSVSGLYVPTASGSITDTSAIVDGYLSGGSASSTFFISYAKGGATATSTPYSYDAGSGFFEFRLSGLSSGTTYNYTIEDASGSPISGSTGSDSFTTTGSTSAKITNFNVTTSPDGSTINFTASVSDIPKDATNYNFTFACGISTSTSPTATQSYNMTTITNPLALSGFVDGFSPLVSPTTPYYCELLAADGVTALTPFQTVTLASAQNDVPYAKSVTDTTATIDINLSSATTSNLSIYYGTDANSLTSAPVSMSLLPPTTTTYEGVLSGLTPNQSYYFVIQPQQSGYIGLSSPISAPQTFTTASSTGTGGGGSGNNNSTNTSGGSGGFPGLPGGLVNCGKSEPGTGKISDPCNLTGLVTMIQKILDFLLFTIAPAIMAIVFVWSGYEYMTSAGNAGKTEKAKTRMLDALIGWLIAMTAWIIVKFIMTKLGYTGPGFWS